MFPLYFFIGIDIPVHGIGELKKNQKTKPLFGVKGGGDTCKSMFIMKKKKKINYSTLFDRTTTVVGIMLEMWTKTNQGTMRASSTEW